MERITNNLITFDASVTHVIQVVFDLIHIILTRTMEGMLDLQLTANHMKAYESVDFDGMSVELNVNDIHYDLLHDFFERSSDFLIKRLYILNRSLWVLGEDSMPVTTSITQSPEEGAAHFETKHGRRLLNDVGITHFFAAPSVVDELALAQSPCGPRSVSTQTHIGRRQELVRFHSERVERNDKALLRPRIQATHDRR